MYLLASTRAPLTANATWQAGWYSNNPAFVDKGITGVVSAYADQPGFITLYQSDDPSDPNMSISGPPTPIVPGIVASVSLPITHRYWQVIITNGDAAQTTFNAAVLSGELVAINTVSTAISTQAANGPTANGFATDEMLLKILNELRAARLAMVTLACESGKANPLDFEPDNVASDTDFLNQTN